MIPAPLLTPARSAGAGAAALAVTVGTLGFLAFWVAYFAFGPIAAGMVAMGGVWSIWAIIRCCQESARQHRRRVVSDHGVGARHTAALRAELTRSATGFGRKKNHERRVVLPGKVFGQR